jgi:hypothetical protein
LAKRYVQGVGSASVRRQLSTSRVATSRLSAIGLASALARREGAFTAAERDRGLKTLNADLAAWILGELTAELMVWNKGASRSAATAIRQQSQ